MWDPRDMGRAIDLALQIEEKNRALIQSGFGSLVTRIPNNPHPVTLRQSKGVNSGTWPRSDASFQRNRNFEDRRLTAAQISEKRAKGLCYKCDDKWNKGHVCKTQINVVLVDEDEPLREEDERELDDTGKIPTTLDLVEVEPVIEVSLSSVAGLSSPKTMKLKGQVWGQPVVTLIDPGVTHNFISSALVS